MGQNSSSSLENWVIPFVPPDPPVGFLHSALSPWKLACIACITWYPYPPRPGRFGQWEALTGNWKAGEERGSAGLLWVGCVPLPRPQLFQGGLSVQLTSLGSANCSLPLPLSGPFRPVALSATSPGDQFSSSAVLTLFTPLKNTLAASPLLECAICFASILTAVLCKHPCLVTKWQ